jgi:proteasome lid subunit RPN8/RPN11
MTSASTFSEPASADAPADTAADEAARGKPGVQAEQEEWQATHPGGRLLLHGRDGGNQQPRVIISQRALRHIEGHSVSALEIEVGGALLGHAHREADRLVVEVLAALPAETEDHGPVHFTFTADTWAQLHRDRAERFPDLEVVGWFHTHPDLGVFLSSDDVVVHSAAFVLPWHIALVVDPVRGEGAFFGWHQVERGQGKQELSALPGFYERLDEQSNSAASWQLVQAVAWQDMGYPPPESHGRVDYPVSTFPALPPISPWWGVILGGLSLLISLLLLLERLIAGLR